MKATLGRLAAVPFFFARAGGTRLTAVRLFFAGRAALVEGFERLYLGIFFTVRFAIGAVDPKGIAVTLPSS